MSLQTLAERRQRLSRSSGTLSPIIFYTVSQKENETPYS